MSYLTLQTCKAKLNIHMEKNINVTKFVDRMQHYKFVLCRVKYEIIIYCRLHSKKNSIVGQNTNHNINYHPIFNS